MPMTSPEHLIDRVLIVFDGDAWFVRGVRVIEHDLSLDEMVYRCDQHLAGPFMFFGDATSFILRGEWHSHG